MKKNTIQCLLISALILTALVSIFCIRRQSSIEGSADERRNIGQPFLTVHIFLYRRLKGATSIMTDLTTADYGSYSGSISLIIHIDYSTDMFAAMNDLAMNWTWPHGHVEIRARERRVGLRTMWLTAVSVPVQGLFFAVEDDMTLSPHYFKWVLKIVELFDKLESTVKENVVGFSLSPQRLDELSYPFRKWLPSDHISTEHTVYASAVPSSWAPIYIGEKWEAFLNFTLCRANYPFYNLTDEHNHILGEKLGDANLYVPNVRSNSWARSWKRFMVDFMYGRGYVMIYPNLPLGAGWATTKHLFGEHVAVEHVHKDPRVAPLERRRQIAELPPNSSKLPVFDNRCRCSSLDHVRLTADQFITSVRMLGPKYTELANIWGRPSQSTTPLKQAKFLIYCPQMGVNNQLRSMVHALFWAQKSERTLVIPHILAPRASASVSTPFHSFVNYHDIFEVDHLINTLPDVTIAFASYEILTFLRPPFIHGPFKSPVYDILQLHYFKAIWGDLPVVDHSIDRLHSFFFEEHASVNILALRDVYFMSPPGLSDSQFNDIFLNIVRPNARTQTYIDVVRAHVLSVFGSLKYTCMHIRSSDFKKMCDDAADISNPLVPEWIIDSVHGGLHCNVSMHSLQHAMRQSQIQNFIIVSDGAIVRSVLQSLNVNARFMTSSDIRTILNNHLRRKDDMYLQVVSLVVDERICAAASELWLNGFSTFSRSIEMLHGSNNNVHFW